MITLKRYENDTEFNIYIGWILLIIGVIIPLPKYKGKN